MLDVNQFAQGHDFYDLGEVAVSPNEQLLAEDTEDVSTPWRSPVSCLATHY